MQKISLQVWFLSSNLKYFFTWQYAFCHLGSIILHYSGRIFVLSITSCVENSFTSFTADFDAFILLAFFHCCFILFMHAMNLAYTFTDVSQRWLHCLARQTQGNDWLKCYCRLPPTLTDWRKKWSWNRASKSEEISTTKLVHRTLCSFGCLCRQWPVAETLGKLKLSILQGK